jgi:lipid II:glycine glycyltransferase (peptidoglycan interpeptide bridge formation enzyme)
MSNRDEYIAKLKAQLDQWNAEIAKWEAKAKEAQADMRIEADKQLDAYKRQRDEAVEQMRKVQTASGDAWRELMHGAEDAWAKMREAFERASSHFNK